MSARWTLDPTQGTKAAPGVVRAGPTVATYERNAESPGVVRVTVRTTAGGMPPRRYFETADGRRWDTLLAARAAARKGAME